MLEQQAVVTRVENEHIYLKSLQTNACSNCHQQSSCGTSLYTKFLPEREMMLSSSLNLKAGDIVLIGIEESHLIRASIFTYLLPLLIMLVIVGFYKGSDTSATLIALVSLAGGLWLVKRCQNHFVSNWLHQPQILSKC